MTMKTKQEAAEFVERLCISWRVVYYNYNTKTPDFRLKEFDRFNHEYYSDFDLFKNMTDSAGRFLFEQLPPDYQQKFNEIIVQYAERERWLSLYRRELDDAKLQKQINKMVRQGLFANSTPPTPAKVTQDWLASYGGNVVRT
jgi:hypothetical protein